MLGRGDRGSVRASGKERAHGWGTLLGAYSRRKDGGCVHGMYGREASRRVLWIGLTRYDCSSCRQQSHLVLSMVETTALSTTAFIGNGHIVSPEETCPIVQELPFSATVFADAFAHRSIWTLYYPMVTTLSLGPVSLSYVACPPYHPATPIHLSRSLCLKG